MRTKVLCTSCEEYVYTDADHSCRDAKALRAVRDAEAAVVEAAEALAAALREVEETHATREPRDGERRHLMGIVSRATREIEFTVRALHAARQGVGGLTPPTSRPG